MGDTSKIDEELVESLEMVESVKRISEPFKSANRKFHPEDSVIDISGYFYASDSFPLGGADIVHYEDEFYRQTGDYINEILAGSSRRVFSTVDDNYLLLRNLRLDR